MTPLRTLIDAITFVGIFLICFGGMMIVYELVKSFFEGWKEGRRRRRHRKPRIIFNDRHADPPRYDLPAFSIDPLLSYDENLDRFEQHLNEFAPEMDREVYCLMVDTFSKAYSDALQMQWERDLQRIQPEDFHE